MFNIKPWMDGNPIHRFCSKASVIIRNKRFAYGYKHILTELPVVHQTMVHGGKPTAKHKERTQLCETSFMQEPIRPLTPGQGMTAGYC